MPLLKNSRHELFAQEIAKGRTQRDAYQAAGYVTKSDGATDASASRLLSNAKVANRIRELQTATPTTAMTHIAITESLNGKNVDWMEKVSDEQYRK